MNCKHKSKLWWLTFPFAHNNYTLVGRVLYYPKGKEIPADVMRHERIHIRQMDEVGLFWFYFLYLFCLPLLFNPWRRKWELEAFIEGSGLKRKEALKLVKSYKYGWLYG